jgi:alkylated DNA repair dioxygenase AlkB
MLDFGAYDVILYEKSHVRYHPKIFTDQESNELLQVLLSEIVFKADVIKIFGKTITTQRLYAWHGDRAFDYAYSGFSRIAQPWTPLLLNTKLRIEQLLQCEFNCCLLNYYANGTQGMAWHSDDEKVMQKNGVIASLSLGAERLFEFKHKTETFRKKIVLQNGSLLQMTGETQKHFLHQLPKTTKVNEHRLNLTFRNFVQAFV